MKKPLWVFAPAAILLAGFIAGFAALIFGGGADQILLGDPGIVIRFGLPMAKLLNDLSMAVTIGALVIAGFAASKKWPEYNKSLDIAAAAAIVWTVSAAGTSLMTFLSMSGMKFDTGDAFAAVLAQFFTEIEAGQNWLYVIVAAALVSILGFAVRSFLGVFWLFLISVSAVYPLAEMGHATGAAGHDVAVTGLFLHILAASFWLGGLATIGLLKIATQERLVTILTRYSSVALLSFFVVALSGYASAAIRVGSFDNLFTPYGILIIAKIAVLGVLGVYGAIQRNWMIRKLAKAETARKARAWFSGVLLSELAFMGIASGLGVALGRTESPVTDEAITGDAATPAEILTGEPLPPELTFSSFYTEWRLDLLWSLCTVLAISWYIWGVLRLRKRGDSWSWWRTASFILGMLIFFYATNGALNSYEKYLFSVHMMAHMVLAMLVPVLLVPGAPITLALRAIKKRKDGSRGMREWILWLVKSWWLRVITNPIVAAIIFAISLWFFYFTGIFRWATEDHLGHIWMVVHFSLSGYLFVLSLIGIDPVHYRPPYPLRLLLLLATMGFHAFFGIAIMTNKGLLLSDWYGAMGWQTGITAMADQQTGGGIAWGIGELPTLLLAVGVAIAWARHDEKQAKREDARAVRTHDAELEAYNEMLARMNKRAN